MSAPDLSHETVEQLREAGTAEHTTLLLGAGASITSGFPSWDDLVSRLLVESGSVQDDEAARLMLTKQDPLMVVEAARAAYGDSWERKLRKALYAGADAAELSPLQRGAIAHYLSGDGTDTTLATLNFDTVLEQGLQEEIGVPVLSRTRSESPSRSEPTVHHLHGAVTPTTVSDVILTLSEFLDLLASTDSWQLSFLREQLSLGGIVIAGTSYRDPDVRQWLHAALRDAPDEHAVMTLLAREGYGVSKSEYAELRTALSSQWEAVGIRPVLLHDYSDAAQVIQELRSIHNPGYLAPRDRARMIWEHHRDSFSALQSLYADALERDAYVMGDVLDVEKLNVSLWIADAEGGLARWAAQDRLYRDVTSLRVVETGHDSAWIAGKALASDVLLVEDLAEKSTRQWRSVLALPIPVLHPIFPAMTSAVLTIGLPGPASDYEDSDRLWGESLSQIGDDWSNRLSRGVF